MQPIDIKTKIQDVPVRQSCNCCDDCSVSCCFGFKVTKSPNQTPVLPKKTVQTKTETVAKKLFLRNSVERK